MPILAQADLGGVPAEIFKWVMIIIVALIVVAGVIVGIYMALRKPGPQKLDDEPPIKVQKSPKRYNHDATVLRFEAVEKRVEDLEGWKEGVAEKMESNKEAIMTSAAEGREKIHARLNGQSRMLFLIAGKLGIHVSQEEKE